MCAYTHKKGERKREHDNQRKLEKERDEDGERLSKKTGPKVLAFC